MRFLVSSILVAVILSLGCSESAKYSKRAEQLESAGLIDEAAEQYRQAVSIDEGNIEAKAGLKRTAQAKLDAVLRDAESFFDTNDNMGAHDRFVEVFEYRDAIERSGVILDISPKYQQLDHQNRQILAEYHYQNGKSAYDGREWNKAISELEKTQQYVPNYKDSKYLLNQTRDTRDTEMAEYHYQNAITYYQDGEWSRAISEFEKTHHSVSNYKSTPRLLEHARDERDIELAEMEMQRGMSASNSRRYRDAYNHFKRCDELKPGYKNVKQMLADAYDNARTDIAIFPFTNATSHRRFHEALYTHVVTEAVNCGSEFVRVIDRGSLSKLLAEQELGATDLVDPATAARAGKLIGLDAVVLGELVSVVTSDEGSETEPVEAYEGYATTDSNGNKVLKGKPVTYTLHRKRGEVRFKAQYKIIDVETGMIVSSDMKSASEQDQTVWASYSGNYRRLMEVDPSMLQDRTFVMASALMGMKADDMKVDERLFTARQSIKSPDEMSEDIIPRLARSIGKAICKYFD